METPTANNVPKDAENPIQYLLDNGHSTVSLAVAWGFRTSDTITRLKRFDYTPPPLTAQKMAETFGWTAGDVINYWLDRVERKAAAQ